MSFVIDRLLHSDTFSRDLATHKTSIDMSRIAMYGHSLGGATAATAMRSDARIKGGINMDGRVFSPVLEKGLDRPFILLGRPNHRAEDATWPRLFSKLTGPRFEMQVEKTMHGSFTDFPVLIDSLNLPEPYKSAAAEMIGAASGKTMSKVVNSVVMGFSDYVFGKTKALPDVLKKGQTKVPELTVLRSEGRH